MITRSYIWSETGPLKKCVHLMSLVLVVTFALLSATALQAETRQHAKHQHGVGEMNVALQGEQLFMELSSPAANIIGFEHLPENEQQEKTIHDAEEALKKGDKLFHFTAQAQCMLKESVVESRLLDEHHGEEHHDESAHEHEHTGHNDIQVTYVFTCRNPDKLKAIDVLLFDRFNGFEEIEVQLLAPGIQTAIELTPKQKRISLK